MNKQGVKSILLTPAWQEIEAYLLGAIKDGIGIDKVKTDGRRYEDIAIDVIAIQEAGKILKRAMNGLKRLANNDTENIESYR